MKNLNPKAGITQISSGTFQIPRSFILDCLLNRKISRAELPYLFIAIQSADWDKDEYRYGFIRHSIEKISLFFDIPYKTIHKNFNGLVKKGFLKKEKIDNQEILIVSNYEYFHKKGAYEATHPKEKIRELLSQKLELKSKNQETNSQIREHNSGKATNSFNVSFKVGNNLSDKDSYQYTQLEWAKIRLQDPGLPSWEDKLLIDESVREATPIKPFHQQVGEALY